MADPDFDALSTCVTLTACLHSLKAWSDANPKAPPLFVFVEPRDDPLFKPTDFVRGNATFGSLLAAMTLADGPKGLTVPPPVDTAALAALNTEILSVFPPTSQLITPAKLAAQAGAPSGTASLARYIPGVKGTGWPALRDGRGKVFIVLVGAKAQAFSAAATAGGSPPAAFVATPAGDAPRDGALFVDAATGPLSMLAAGGVTVATTAAAAAKAATTITAAAKRGALVRAAADWGGLEPASGATARRDAVLGAGAHFVFTDAPWARRRVGPVDYASPLPRRPADGSDRAVAARCNPVTSPNRDSINVEAHGCGAWPEDASEAETIVVVGRAAAAPAARARGRPQKEQARAAAGCCCRRPGCRRDRGRAGGGRRPRPRRLGRARAPGASSPRHPPPASRTRLKRGTCLRVWRMMATMTAARMRRWLSTRRRRRRRRLTTTTTTTTRRPAPPPATRVRAPPKPLTTPPPSRRRGSRTARAPESRRAADDDAASSSSRSRRPPPVDDDDDDEPATPRRAGSSTRRTRAPATPTPPPPPPTSAGLADVVRSSGTAGAVALEAGDSPNGRRPAVAAAPPPPPVAQARPAPPDDGFPTGSEDDAMYAIARPSLLPG